MTDALDWQGGTVSGSGTLTISSQATSELSPGYGGTSTLDGIALDNLGTATFTGGVIAGADSGVFDNEPGGTLDFDIPPGGACCYSGFQDITLNNYGTIDWISGNLGTGNGVFNNEAGATFNADADGQMVGDTFDNLAGATFAVANDGNPGAQMALDFNNAGTVDVNSGSLTLGYFYVTGAAISSGTFYGAPGTSLGFMVSQDFTSTSIIDADNVGFSWFDGYFGGLYTVAGTYQATDTTEISGTTVDFTGSVSLGAALNVASAGTADFSPADPVTVTTGECTVSGTLTGSDSLAIGGPLNWSGGTLSTTGTVEVLGGMTINGGVLDGTTLDNYGTADWDSGAIGASDGAVFNNEPGAAFDVPAPAAVGNFNGNDGGTTGVFNNLRGATICFGDGGTSGTPNVVMALDLNNSGALYLLEGALTLGTFYMPGSAVSSGSFYGRREPRWGSWFRKTSPPRRSSMLTTSALVGSTATSAACIPSPARTRPPTPPTSRARPSSSPAR